MLSLQSSIVVSWQRISTQLYHSHCHCHCSTHKVFFSQHNSFLGIFSNHCRLPTPETESESYITTDGQSVSLSWNKAPVWGLRPDFCYCQTVAVCWRRALSLTRGMVCRLQLLLVLASAVILGSESSGSHDHILLSQIWDSPDLEDQVSVFISPSNRVARLYPQALGIIFPELNVFSFYSLLADRI
jgi:hypothetical protein